MKKNLYKVLLFVSLLLSVKFHAQSITVQSYTACPNQVVTVTAQWNNVAMSTLTLLIPSGGTGPANPTSLTFTVTNSLATPPTFTLLGTGTGGAGTTTSSATFNINIYNPPPLTITNTINYCPGTTAMITAPSGGNTYILTGPGGSTSYNSNIINIPNLASNHNGAYTVTSVGSCTMTGTTTINVAPTTPIAVNTTSNVCQNSDFTLTANLTNGTNYQWYDPQQQPIPPQGANIIVLTATSATMAGIYKINADYNFSGLMCPRSATTEIKIVPTSPVSIIASPGNVLCQGDKLSLSASAGGLATAWAWSGPAAFSSSIPNPTIFPMSPANAGSYTATAFFTNSIITCTTSNVVNITVVAVTQPVIYMPTNVCQYSTVNFSATAGPGATFTWFGPGYTATGQINKIDSIMPSNAGTYYVTTTANNSTCAATASTQLNVVSLNTISVIPPQPVCQPDNAYLQANATGAISYLWEGPNGFSSSLNNTTIYYPTVAHSGIYTVTASFGGGNIICKTTNTVSLNIYPVMNFSLVPRQQACYNSSLEVQGPEGATSYTWTSSTGFTSNQRDINFPSVQPINAGTYTLNISLGPCITTGSTTIEVLNPISFTLTPKDRTICRGDTTFIEGAVTGGSENYAYLWNPSIYLDSPTGPSKTIIPAGTVIYNLTAHDIACPHFTLSHSFSVVVNQPPQPNLQLPMGEGCAPLCLLYDAKIKPEEEKITTYDFGGTLQFQRDSAFYYCLDEPGIYTLTIHTLGQNGCGGTYKYPYPLVVNPKPGSDIFWSPEKPTTSDEITFYATYKNDPIIYHNWYFSGGQSSVIDTAAPVGPGSDTTNAFNPSRRYTEYGKFPVMLVSMNDRGCQDTVVKFLDVIDDLNVFIPNSFTPNGDGINDDYGVKGMGMKVDGFSMELCDRSGSTFFMTKDINERWDGKINGTVAMQGTYVYKIRVVGMNGEGRREYVGYFNLIR